jgi:two-component system OmpR family response regulator
MGTSLNILLVDDETDLTTTLVERLSIRGFLATAVQTGDEALAAIRGNSFDVVVLDIKLKGEDGLDVMKKIKQIDRQLPVILLTGHMSKEASDEGFEAGAIDYVIKPIDIEEFIIKLRKAAPAV